MRRNTDPGNLRRNVTGLCLIAWPFVALVGAALEPRDRGGLEGMLAFIADHDARWLLGNFLVIVGYCLVIPAVLGLLPLFRARGLPGHRRRRRAEPAAQRRR